MTEITEEAIGEFAGHIAGMFTGAAISAAIWVGDATGLYRTMAGHGPMSAADVAAAAGTEPRLTQEWLDSHAAAGMVDVDHTANTYELNPIQAMVLADEASPAFMARGVQGIGAAMRGIDKIIEAYQSDGAMSWGEHDPCLFCGTEWFFRPGYRTFLTDDWIPAMGEDVAARLADGGSVADVGCGHGVSVAVIADAYPNATVTGIDFHGPSIDTARERAAEAGVADRCEFEVADAKSYDGSYDLICFFDCLHDMGDPTGALAHARSRLTDGGAVMLVEPFALDDKADNMAKNPMSPMLYAASCMFCVPNSLSQEVRRGLGAQAGEAKLREIATEAGFTEMTRVAETPTNLILRVG